MANKPLHLTASGRARARPSRSVYCDSRVPQVSGNALGGLNRAMYQVDQRDSVVELYDVPRPDVGAPLPAVVASGRQLELVYRVSERGPNRDGTDIHVVGTTSEGQLVARIRFDHPYAHMFGPPDDEAFTGHPLASRGLGPYKVWEVHDSSWLRSLEHMNSIHPHHSRDAFMCLRHFVFAFHDATFECIASRYDCHVERGSVAAVAAAVPAGWVY